MVVRGRYFSQLPLLEDGRIVRANRKELFQSLGVAGLIRLSRKDFSCLDAVGNYLTHFNLESTNHKVGKNYALVRIIKPGSFDGKKQVLPVISVKNAVVAECIGARNHVPYERITKADFKHSFSHIKDVPQLKKAILARYSRSMPGLSKEEILALGVGVTRLKIMRRIS